MSPQSRRTVVACMALAAILALLAELAAAPDEAPQASNETIQQRAVNPPAPLKPIETYAAIAERPLFQPSRRPALPPPPVPVSLPVAAPAPAAPAPPPPPPPVLTPMTLLAVAISPDRREAVFSLSGGKSTTMAEGESLNGWVLTRVLPDRAVFRLADIEKEVSFPVAQTTAQPVAPHRNINPSPPTPRPR